VHCVAHRLALVVIQAAKTVTPVDRFKGYINSLFVYFHGSAKRQGKLQEAFQSLENRPTLKLRKPSDTHWLACDEAIQTVKKSLHPLAVALQELATDDATALGLSTLLNKYQFVAGVYFMAEILPILSRLLKTFQYENFDYGSIKPVLARARDNITTLKCLSKNKQADWQKELLQYEQFNNLLVTVKSPFYPHLY
jgi:hypothetical protein